MLLRNVPKWQLKQITRFCVRLNDDDSKVNSWTLSLAINMHDYFEARPISTQEHKIEDKKMALQAHLSNGERVRLYGIENVSERVNRKWWDSARVRKEMLHERPIGHTKNACTTFRNDYSTRFCFDETFANANKRDKEHTKPINNDNGKPNRSITHSPSTRKVYICVAYTHEIFSGCMENHLNCKPINLWKYTLFGVLRSISVVHLVESLLGSQSKPTIPSACRRNSDFPLVIVRVKQSVRLLLPIWCRYVYGMVWRIYGI